jgi:hypothetical protein
VSDVTSTYEARGNIKRQKKKQTLYAPHKRKKKLRCYHQSQKQRGNRIRVFPVSAFEASLLEKDFRLDTMITEEVAKESSDIAYLGACRIVVRLKRQKTRTTNEPGIVVFLHIDPTARVCAG